MAKELKLYLPLILQDIAEYDALSSAEGVFMEDIENKTNRLVDDSFLTTMSESRLVEWENALGIVVTNNSLEQRRSVVLSRFRGTGKLSKTLIQTIVNAFTGGTATVKFADGILSVRITPPSSTFSDFSVDKLTQELVKRKPAHLLMSVELSYITWKQLKDTFSSWEDVRTQFNDWNEIYQFYINQEAYRLWH